MSNLTQRITLSSGIAIAVGMIVGSGFFGLPGIIITQSGPVAAFLGWVTVMVLIAPMVHIFAQLGLRYPTADGAAKYGEIALGGWAYYGFSLVACGALAVGMPAFFFVGGAYVAELLQLDPAVYRAPFAIVLAIVTTLLNLWGPEKFSRIGKLVVPAVLLFIIGIVLAYLPGRGDAMARLSTEIFSHPPDLNHLWLAAAIAFWAYQGWENMSFGLEELQQPEKTIPVIYWSSFALISLIYLAFAWMVSSLYYDGLVVSGVSGIAALIGGGVGVRTILLLLIVGILIVNANSWVFGASRLVFAAARMGLLPTFLNRLDKRSLPRNSLIVCLLAYVLVIVGMEVMTIPVHNAFLITTQGFIVLYGGAILAYLKVSQTVWKWPISVAALGSWMFLMSGFSWLLVYPAVLLLVGWALFKRGKAGPGQIQTGKAYGNR